MVVASHLFSFYWKILGNVILYVVGVYGCRGILIYDTILF